MKCLKIFTASLALLIATFAHAHPGSGIAVDDHGTVYFTDTGKGLWKLPPDGKLALISPMSYHFMGLDGTGAYSKSPAKFGRWFERATPEGTSPTIIECSEFPMAIGRDGNIYYANTLKRPTKIVKRTPAGTETVLTELADEAPTAAEKGRESYVTGITVAPDGSLYLVEAAAQAEFVVIRKVEMDGKVSVAARSFVPADLKFDSKPAVAPSSVPAGEPVPQISRTYCRGLTVAEDGTIYVAANAVRTVLAIDPQRKVRVILEAEAPWSPTDVALWHGELYVLEYDHTGEDRKFWTPRVRKVDADGKVKTLATVTRNLTN